MKMLLGDFYAKLGREDIFKPTIGNECSHEIINDNGIRVVNFATCSLIAAFINTPGPLLMERHTTRWIMF
jgi:hypothetical protein